MSGQTQDTINEKVYNYLAVVWMLKNPKVYSTPGGVDYILKKSSTVNNKNLNDIIDKIKNILKKPNNNANNNIKLPIRT